MVTWHDSIPVSILYSVPHIDRVSGDAQNNCTVTRRVKCGDGTKGVVKVYRPEIFNFFEENMGGVDVL